MEIRNTIAVVTGAASGIGKAVAFRLAGEGVRGLGLVDHSERLHEVVDPIRQQFPEVAVQACLGEVTDPAFRAYFYGHVCDTIGLPQILVPAAGIVRDGLAVKLNKQSGKAEIYAQEAFREVVEVNLIAPTYWALELVARLAADRLKRGLGRWVPGEHIQGTVIFIGSVSSQGNKGQIAYAATKAGLQGVAATLMKESMFHGVRCGVIHPGYTDTPMVRGLGEEFIATHILPQTQLNRLIRPEEIADAICFMISNSAVSGELWADAGWHPAA